MKLVRTLIEGSLLISNFAFTFALTSCSKKNNDNENNTSRYLCNLTPKLINDDCTENESDIISSTFAKNLLNEGYGFNHNFLDQIDPTFDDPLFLKRENKNDSNSKITDITTSLGKIKVYYLNAEVGRSKKEIVFTINSDVLYKINTLNDLNKIIKFQSFTKWLVNDGDKSSLKLLVSEENDQNFFWEIENNVETAVINNEDVKKIKKIKLHFPNNIPTDLNSSGFGGFLLTFKTLEGKKPITIVIKFVNGKEYKFFNAKDFYHSKLKKAFDSTLFLDKIGDKSLAEYIDKIWLEKENESDWTKVELDQFALQQKKDEKKEKEIKWRLKDRPCDNFLLQKKSYYHYLNQYRHYKEKKHYKWNNSGQQEQLCCKYNAIDVLCEIDNMTNHLKLHQKYEGEECSYRLHFYQLFNVIKDLAPGPFEFVINVVDMDNREINIWTNDNKLKYVDLTNENKIMIKKHFFEKINRKFCRYFDVMIPKISTIKKRNVLNSINKETEYKFYLTFNLKYKNIDFYKYKIEIRYIND